MAVTCETLKACMERKNGAQCNASLRVTRSPRRAPMLLGKKDRDDETPSLILITEFVSPYNHHLNVEA